MTWFAKWFDSKYYHILYNYRDEKEAKKFINNLIKKLNIKKKSKLLDIACGKGRHANYFNKKGMDVTGIDLSKNSINYANTFSNASLSFHVHDMRKIFKENYFDIVTNLFTSFGYFENKDDNLITLQRMSQNLKNNGLLIIDFMNTKKVIDNLIPNEKKNIHNINFNIKRYIKNNYIIKEIEVIDNKIKKRFQEKVQCINLKIFQDLIKKSNLKIVNIFGDYELNEYSESCSDRLILICKNNY